MGQLTPFLKIKITFALLAGLTVAFNVLGCSAKKNYLFETRTGRSAYGTVQCKSQENPDGFSIEFPRCFCNGGVYLRYVVKAGSQNNADNYFELRRGYLSKYTPEIRIISSDGYKINRLLIKKGSGEFEELRRNSQNEIEFQRNELILADIMIEFAPKLYEVEMFCNAKQYAATI
jgi:hypothetical protein